MSAFKEWQKRNGIKPSVTDIAYKAFFDAGMTVAAEICQQHVRDDIFESPYTEGRNGALADVIGMIEIARDAK